MDNRVKAPKKRLGLNNKSIKVRSSSKIPEFDKKCVDKKSYEMHYTRLNTLREIAESLNNDSWKYESLDKHLGLI